MRPTIAFAGVGTLTADLLQLGTQMLSSAFIGIGTMTVTPVLRMMASATFGGDAGLMSTTPILRMVASQTMAATGAFVASAPTITSTSSAVFSGVGTQATSPVLWMVASELLAGVGTLVADVTVAGAATVWQATAAFTGAGTLTALNLKQWMAANAHIQQAAQSLFRPRCVCACSRPTWLAQVP